jgi:NAD(P)-dependent dehydrogenase (short-subunit alcohol dehydrogenase family)
MIRRRRLDLEGRVALVTGGGAGIGLAVGRELHRRGASVVLADVDADTLAEAARALGGERVQTVCVDVRDRPGMAAAITALREREGRLDVVVANAGVTPQPGTVRRGHPQDFDRVLDVNLHGTLNTLRPAVDALVEQGGHAVLVASVAAFTPTPGGAAYTVSKAGVEALGRCLRIELAPFGVSVGVAYFGVVETAMTRGTLDEDPIGRSLEAILPGPLRHRISPDQAARTLVDGIQARAPRTLAPARWAPYALLRGVLDVGVDAVSARDPRLARIVRRLEARAEAEAPADAEYTDRHDV